MGNRLLSVFRCAMYNGKPDKVGAECQSDVYASELGRHDVTLDPAESGSKIRVAQHQAHGEVESLRWHVLEAFSYKNYLRILSKVDIILCPILPLVRTISTIPIVNMASNLPCKCHPPRLCCAYATATDRNQMPQMQSRLLDQQNFKS